MEEPLSALYYSAHYALCGTIQNVSDFSSKQDYLLAANMTATYCKT